MALTIQPIVKEHQVEIVKLQTMQVRLVEVELKQL
jgi:hypothetical protein